MKDIEILLVEGARGLRHDISASLGLAGARVKASGTIFEARQSLLNHKPRFLILDVDGQSEDVLSFLSELDSLNIATIVLADDTQIDQRIEYFERRVMDVVPKPLHLHEVNLRLRRFLRPNPATKPDLQIEIACGRATLDIATRSLRQARKKTVALTGSEFRLLYLLLQKDGAVVDRTIIMRDVLGQSQDSTSRSINVIMSKLRRKLDDIDSGRFIRSVRSEGYMLVGEDKDEPRADTSYISPNIKMRDSINGMND